MPLKETGFPVTWIAARWRTIATLLAVVACLFGFGLSSAATEELTEPDLISLKDLRAKYEKDASHYVTVDGVEIHYVDEGKGPPLVILHPSFLSLNAWDGMADRLKRDYRVIRFDFPGQGLSGLEKPPPEGVKIEFTERNADITRKFLKMLGLEKVSMIATSTGASAGFRYASYYPDRVERLILINSAGMPRMTWTNPNRVFASESRWKNLKIKPKDFWAGLLDRNFVEPNEPPDWLAELAVDMNRRADKRGPNIYKFETGDPKAILAGINAPTLILWGMTNPTVMHLEADVIEHWMTGAPTLAIKYENIGHYPYVEHEAVTYGDMTAFLSGRMDDSLRQTQRVKVPIQP